MARYQIKHNTRYLYPFPAYGSQNLAHLRPRDDEFQLCESFQLRITPEPDRIVERRDFFHNHLILFSIQETHREFIVETESRVEVAMRRNPDPRASMTPVDYRGWIHHAAPALNDLAIQYTTPSPLVPEAELFEERARAFFPDDQPVLVGALELLGWMQESFSFDPKATDVSTPVLTFAEQGRGVCQDFAHYFLGVARAAGLACAYVSGYLLTTPPPGKERLLGADASHAWVSLYLPEHGWMDLDPTNNLTVRDEHITVARGRDYKDVSVLRGCVVGGGRPELEVKVSVIPEEELVES